jgi:hypothetical protein
LAAVVRSEADNTEAMLEQFAAPFRGPSQPRAPILEKHDDDYDDMNDC